MMDQLNRETPKPNELIQMVFKHHGSIADILQTFNPQINDNKPEDREYNETLRFALRTSIRGEVWSMACNVIATDIAQNGFPASVILDPLTKKQVLQISSISDLYTDGEFDFYKAGLYVAAVMRNYAENVLDALIYRPDVYAFALDINPSDEKHMQNSKEHYSNERDDFFVAQTFGNDVIRAYIFTAIQVAPELIARRGQGELESVVQEIVANSYHYKNSLGVLTRQPPIISLLKRTITIPDERQIDQLEPEFISTFSSLFKVHEAKKLVGVHEKFVFDMFASTNKIDDWAKGIFFLLRMNKGNMLSIISQLVHEKSKTKKESANKLLYCIRKINSLINHEGNTLLNPSFFQLSPDPELPKIDFKETNGKTLLDLEFIDELVAPESVEAGLNTTRGISTLRHGPGCAALLGFTINQDQKILIGNLLGLYPPTTIGVTAALLTKLAFTDSNMLFRQ